VKFVTERERLAHAVAEGVLVRAGEDAVERQAVRRARVGHGRSPYFDRDHLHERARGWSAKRYGAWVAEQMMAALVDQPGA
jgi:hypothetical protein